MDRDASWEFIPAHEEAASASDDEATLTAEGAGSELADLLYDLRSCGKLAANYVCIIAHYAKLAGAQGEVRRLALAPGRQSGAYSQHLDRIRGEPTAAHDWYKLELPRFSKYDGSRETRGTEVLPVHEVLHAEVTSDFEGMRAKVDSMLAANQLPPCYTEHKVVREALDGELVVPIALYTDGIAHEKRDSVLGVYVWNLASRTHHLVGCFKKNLNFVAVDAKRGAAYTR